MKRVTANIGLATGVKIANSWLLTDGGGRRFLIDTGYFTDRPALLAHLWLAGVRGKKDLTAVLLTHRHSDHAANAAWLREKFDCPVICHAKDAPFLDGKKVPPRMATGRAPIYQEWLNFFEDAYPARSVVDETYEEGAWKWNFNIIPTPGHTEGSVMLLHEPTGTLFSGDNIIAGLPPLRFIEHLTLAAPGFSQDTEQCDSYVRKFLKQLPRVETLCSGHGPIVLKDTSKKLMKLLQHSEASCLGHAVNGQHVGSRSQ